MWIGALRAPIHRWVGPFWAREAGPENKTRRCSSQNIKRPSTSKTDPLNMPVLPDIYKGAGRRPAPLCGSGPPARTQIPGGAHRAPPGTEGAGRSPAPYMGAGPSGPRTPDGHPDPDRGPGPAPQGPDPGPNPKKAVFEKCPKTNCRFLLKF